MPGVPNGAYPVLLSVNTFAWPRKHTEEHRRINTLLEKFPCPSVCFRGEVIKPEHFPNSSGFALRSLVLP